jgi:hypothetical protein
MPVTGRRVMRYSGSHTVYTIRSQMAVWLSALRSGRALLFRNIFICFCYLYLLQADPRALVRLQGLGKLKKKTMTSSGLEPVSFLLTA